MSWVAVVLLVLIVIGARQQGGMREKPAPPPPRRTWRERSWLRRLTLPDPRDVVAMQFVEDEREDRDGDA
ncbi:hypothetical protein DAETH_37290 (plasmid) [Deinococcus aetherius]|uniref:Secreted protein n=1 Tax=Deinococcus aetherius TaxID=200252 RepID=A0ABM8AIV8_9DEIO|nr:hypothetical protein [Deinococcus aetherius]BDP43760.1 hypothetical protein DAETH_37290 [Deinococcus aetherius]